MRNFYSPLKACDPYLRYVFLTGITKFSQLSIFSELNNIKNISMDEPYAVICGIAKMRYRLQMKDDLEGLAKKLEITPEEALMKLKENYDGYHFTSPSPDIYNPFSLLNAFCSMENLDLIGLVAVRYISDKYVGEVWRRTFRNWKYKGFGRGF